MQKCNHKNRGGCSYNKGYTLVEIVLVLLILSSLFLGLVWGYKKVQEILQVNHAVNHFKMLTQAKTALRLAGIRYPEEEKERWEALKPFLSIKPLHPRPGPDGYMFVQEWGTNACFKAGDLGAPCQVRVWKNGQWKSINQVP